MHFHTLTAIKEPLSLINGSCAKTICARTKLIRHFSKLIGIHPNPGPESKFDIAISSTKGRTSMRSKGKGKKDKLQRQNRCFGPTESIPHMSRYIPVYQEMKVCGTYELLAALATSASVETFNAFSFTLNGIHNAGDLAAVFDQYRIDLVEFWLIPRFALNTSTNTLGLMTSVLDFDDASSLSTVATALDYDTSMTASGMTSHYRVFKPRVAVAAYGGAFTSYKNEAADWCDTASLGIQHYGVKIASTVTNAIYTWDAIVRLHATLRAVR